MEIEIEDEGLRYVAEVEVADGVVTVMTDAGGMEMTSIGGSRIEPLARIMLLRMVKAGKANPVAG